MPRAFTTVEKETIRDRLIEVGRACFLRYGMRKTTIEDLVKPIGIAKASFYLFFESKEALYLEVFVREIPNVMQRLIDVSFGATDSARDALILLMKAIANEMESNPLARVILDDPSEIDKLMSNLDYEALLQEASGAYKPIIDEIVAAQERGEIIQGDPYQIAFSLGLIKMLPVNRDRMPASIYDSLIDFAPQVIADGLTCPARKGGSS